MQMQEDSTKLFSKSSIFNNSLFCKESFSLFSVLSISLLILKGKLDKHGFSDRRRNKDGMFKIRDTRGFYKIFIR